MHIMIRRKSVTSGPWGMGIEQQKIDSVFFAVSSSVIGMSTMVAPQCVFMIVSALASSRSLRGC